MVVRQFEPRDATLRPTSRVRCRIGIDVERRNPIELGRRAHRREVDPKPIIEVGTVVRQNPGWPSGGRPPQKSLHADRAGYLTGGALCRILQVRRDEPAIDEDGAAPRFPERGQHLVALPSALGCRTEKNFLVMQKYPLVGDMPELHTARLL